MMKPILAAVLALSLSSCATTSQATKDTLKTLANGELDCAAPEIQAQMPVILPAVQALLSLTMPNWQDLLNGLKSAAPQLIACTVQNLVNTLGHSNQVGTEMKPEVIEKNNLMLKNGKTAMDGWTKKK